MVKDLQVALARCIVCGRRCRVLPADVVSHKRYGLAVIARLASAHTEGNQSLRMAAWTTHTGKTPAHSTLHAWTEGLGAHVLGRPFGSQPVATPFATVLAQTSARWSVLASTLLPQPLIDPLRYRSDDRRERLVAVRGLLQLALVVASAIAVAASVQPTTSPRISAPQALCAWRSLAVEHAAKAPFAFRSGICSTPIEHRDRSHRQSPGPPPQTGDPTCQTRTRSPPGDSNRSLPTSIPPSTSPNGEA